MVDGLPNGYGDVNHDGRLMYEGNLVNGKPVGLGIFRFHPFLVWHDNIEFLQGDAEKTMYDLSGLYVINHRFKNDAKFIAGTWDSDGFLNGYVVILNKHGDPLYKGELERGKFHGRGTLIENGSKRWNI